VHFHLNSYTYMARITHLIEKNLDLGTKTTYSSRTTTRMILSSRLEYNGGVQNMTKRKAIKVNGRGWSTTDIFRDFFVVNEAIYKKTPRYDILNANETSLEDVQQGEQACFVLLKVKGEVKFNFELNFY
jgi:hypothetical protein